MELDYEIRGTCSDRSENLPIKPSEGTTLEYCQNAVLKTPDVNYFFWQDSDSSYNSTRCTFYETCKEDEKRMPNSPGILYRVKKNHPKSATKTMPQTTKTISPMTEPPANPLKTLSRNPTTRTTTEILPIIVQN